MSVSNPALFKDSIDNAIAQGIPVICLDADAPDSKRVLFIGTDNFRAGQESGKRMAELLKGQGNVVIIGLSGQLNVEERVRGVNDVLKKYPGIKVVQTIDDKGDPRIANDAVSTLQAGKVDGIICLEASGGAGAAEALHRVDATGKIKVVAFDADPETLDWIQKGVIAATIAQKPYTMAFVGMQMLDNLYHHKPSSLDRDWSKDSYAPIPSFVDTGSDLIAKSNVDAFIQAGKSLAAPK